MAMQKMPEVKVFEVNGVGVAGMDDRVTTQKIGWALAELLGMEGELEDTPSPWERWVRHIGGNKPPIVIDNAPGTGYTLKNTLILDKLGEPLPRTLTGDSTRFWLNICAEDLGEEEIHPTVRWALERASNPLGFEKVEPKRYLIIAALANAKWFPKTVPPEALTAAERKQGFVFKPRHASFGGHGVSTNLPPKNKWGQFIAQEEVHNYEPFLIAENGRWRLARLRCDLRVYVAAKRGQVKEVGGYLTRIAGPGHLTCNIKEGGMLAAGEFYARDPRALLHEWHVRLKKIPPARVRELTEKISRAGGLLYGERPIPVATRPRFLPQSAANTLFELARDTHHFLWALNGVVSPVGNPWHTLMPWEEQAVWYGIDCGASFA